MTMWRLSYIGRVKYSFFPKKGYAKNWYIVPNLRAPSKIKRHLLTSLKVNDVRLTKLVSCDDIGNMMLTAQEA